MTFNCVTPGYRIVDLGSWRTPYRVEDRDRQTNEKTARLDYSSNGRE